MKHKAMIGKVKNLLLAALTSTSLMLTIPKKNQCAVITLNPYEENASVEALLQSFKKKVIVVTPNTLITEKIMRRNSIVLSRDFVEMNIVFKKNTYLNMLSAYIKSSTTYATHCMLPGKALTQKREHVILTHGSGAKREIAMQTPANSLCTITKKYQSEQIGEYSLKQTARVYYYQPRLQILAQSVRSESIRTKLSVPIGVTFVLLAPTYRVSDKNRKNQRIAGTPYSSIVVKKKFKDLIDRLIKNSCFVILKIHSADLDDFTDFEVPIITDAKLMSLEITAYEIFGAADLLITDYSSLYEERMAFNLPVETFSPDLDEFKDSYRGFRKNFKQKIGLENLEYQDNFFETLGRS